jgi:hypothetical protein
LPSAVHRHPCRAHAAAELTTPPKLGTRLHHTVSDTNSQCGQSGTTPDGMKLEDPAVLQQPGSSDGDVKVGALSPHTTQGCPNMGAALAAAPQTHLFIGHLRPSGVRWMYLKVVREGGGGMAYGWSAAEGKWEKIGMVVDEPGTMTGAGNMYQVRGRGEGNGVS